jgi:hypothetical protein
MSNIEDIINSEDWSKKFDDITGKDLQEEIKAFADKVLQKNTEILERDIFSSKHSQFLFEKVEMELRSFSMYYQIKGLIQSTDYEFAKDKVIEDTGMEEKTFEIIMARGQMLEAMVIFPRVAEYCAEIFQINLDTDSEDIDEIYKNMFGKEEDNDES